MIIKNFWEQVLIRVSSSLLISLGSALGTSALVVWLAIDDSLSDFVFRYVPKTILLILPLVILLLLLLALSYIIILRKKIKGELKQALGVYWDKELNPYCPACKSILSNYAFHRSGSKYFPGFKCIKCKDIIHLSGETKMFIEISEAKEVVKNLFNKK